MSKIKVSETFRSIQGEGKFTGVPSVFLRTFGCNLKCPGFGLPPGHKTNEPDEIAKNVKLYKKFEDLPLVKFGCDSYASWHEGFKSLSPIIETDELAERITKLNPTKSWENTHLVITGGEPLLGWHRAYPDLLDHPLMETLTDITFETNGTQKLTPKFKEYLVEWKSRNHKREVTFSVSAKLSASGECHCDTIKPDVVVDYETVGSTYLKFVVGDFFDCKEAVATLREYRTAGFTGDCYLMPAATSIEDLNKRSEKIANFCLEHDLRYSDRLHVRIYNNAWGT